MWTNRAGTHVALCSCGADAIGSHEQRYFCAKCLRRRIAGSPQHDGRVPGFGDRACPAAFPKEEKT